MSAMPFVLIVLVLSVAVGRLAGGRVSHLARIELQRTWLVFLAVGVQLALVAVSASGGHGAAWGRPLLAASHLAVLAFIAANRRQPGMPLVFVGLALNAIVIIANGAMPVAPEALAALGGDGTVDPGKHEALDTSTRLPVLADVIPVPFLRSVVSLGDLALAAGVGMLVVFRMRAPDHPDLPDGEAPSAARRPDEGR